MKIIAFKINQPRGEVDPAIQVFANDGFASVVSPEVGRLRFEFDSELISDEFTNFAALQRPVYEKPVDAVEVEFNEISRSTTGFELALVRVDGESLTPYDSNFVCVVTVDS